MFDTTTTGNATDSKTKSRPTLRIQQSSIEESRKSSHEESTTTNVGSDVAGNRQNSTSEARELQDFVPSTFEDEDSLDLISFSGFNAPRQEPVGLVIETSRPESPPPGHGGTMVSTLVDTIKPIAADVAGLPLIPKNDRSVERQVAATEAILSTGVQPGHAPSALELSSGTGRVLVPLKSALKVQHCTAIQDFSSLEQETRPFAKSLTMSKQLEFRVKSTKVAPKARVTRSATRVDPYRRVVKATPSAPAASQSIAGHPQATKKESTLVEKTGLESNDVYEDLGSSMPRRNSFKRSAAAAVDCKTPAKKVRIAQKHNS